MLRSDKLYQGDPEDLAKIGKSREKQSTDSFVNPGTPENPLVTQADRKTGLVSGSASEKLRQHNVPKG